MLYLASKYYAQMGGVEGGAGRGEVFRRALASNAGLGGDSCNRGMLLGSLLGAIVGASGLPSDLVEGLVRGREVRPCIDTLAQLSLSTPVALKGTCTPLGIPTPPLPLRLYPLAGGVEGVQGVVYYPRDFASKLARIKADAEEARVPMDALCYAPLTSTTSARGYAMVSKEGGGVEVITLPPPASTPGLSGVFLDQGDAKRDRAEALGVAVVDTSLTTVLRAWERGESWRSEDGTGVFIYTHPLELAARGRRVV